METNKQFSTDPVQLFQDNLKLTSYFAQKYFPRVSKGTFLYEELVAEARMALWRAANTYEPERSKFTTYAGKCIYGYMLKYYSRVHKKQAVAFDNSLEFSPDENDCCIGDLLLISDFNTEAAAISNITTTEVLKAVKEKYHILDMYFIQGLSQTAIATKLGRSQVQISRDIKKALNSVKYELKLA